MQISRLNRSHSSFVYSKPDFCGLCLFSHFEIIKTKIKEKLRTFNQYRSFKTCWQELVELRMWVRDRYNNHTHPSTQILTPRHVPRGGTLGRDIFGSSVFWILVFRYFSHCAFCRISLVDRSLILTTLSFLDFLEKPKL